MNSIELLAISITVSDTTGPSHSLSSLNDPALADIVADLNAGTSQVDAPVTTYAFGNAPSQFSAYISALAAGDSVNGGRTFDLLLAATPPASNSDVWGLDLSNEVGHCVMKPRPLAVDAFRLCRSSVLDVCRRNESCAIHGGILRRLARR